MSQALNRRIAFVVDDKSVIAGTLELILLSKGFDARSFVDPLDALQAAQNVSPDLLLTDVVMPRMTGIELAIEIKRRHPACKVLLTSGQHATTELLEAASSQGHHFEILAKPTHPTAMIQKIEELFDSADLRTETTKVSPELCSAPE